MFPPFCFLFISAFFFRRIFCFGAGFLFPKTASLQFFLLLGQIPSSDPRLAPALKDCQPTSCLSLFLTCFRFSEHFARFSATITFRSGSGFTSCCRILLGHADRGFSSSFLPHHRLSRGPPGRVWERGNALERFILSFFSFPFGPRTSLFFLTALKIRTQRRFRRFSPFFSFSACRTLSPEWPFFLATDFFSLWRRHRFDQTAVLSNPSFCPFFGSSPRSFAWSRWEPLS